MATAPITSALLQGEPIGPLLPATEAELPPATAAGLRARFEASVAERFEGEQAGFWREVLASYGRHDAGGSGLDRPAFHKLCDSIFGVLGPLPVIKHPRSPMVQAFLFLVVQAFLFLVVQAVGFFSAEGPRISWGVLQGLHKTSTKREQAAGFGEGDHLAATRVQSMQRGRVARRGARSRGESRRQAAARREEEAAATKVQSRQRGRVARRRASSRRGAPAPAPADADADEAPTWMDALAVDASRLSVVEDGADDSHNGAGWAPPPDCWPLPFHFIWRIIGRSDSQSRGCAGLHVNGIVWGVLLWT